MLCCAFVSDKKHKEISVKEMALSKVLFILDNLRIE